MINKTGILIIAAGHPIFGELAANLLMSLKATNCQYPIALASMPCALQTLPDGFLDGLYDIHIDLPNEATCTQDGKRQWVKCKQYLDLIQPFEKTLYIDADTCIINGKQIDQIIQIINKFNFHPLVYGWGDLDQQACSLNYFWLDKQSDISKLRDYYNIQRNVKYIYAFNSTMIWFDRSNLQENIFNEMRKIQEMPYPDFAKTWRDGYPDEFLYMIAAARNGFKTHLTDYKPVYIDVMERGIQRGTLVKQVYEIRKKYHAISMVGRCGDQSLQCYHNQLYLHQKQINKNKWFRYHVKEEYIQNNPLSKYNIQPDEPVASKMETSCAFTLR